MRAYTSALRREQAQTTRAAIVDAARHLFTTQGYAATSIEQVAAQAGVNRRTVYDSIGGKQRVLLAILEQLAPGDEARLDAEIEAHAGDAEVQLRLAVGFVTRLYERAGDVMEMVRAAGGADPDLAALDHEGEERRRSNERAMIDDWHRRGLLRRGLSAAKAGDVMWAMTSPALYRLLVTERGWSTRRYRAWLIGDLAHQLLG